MDVQFREVFNVCSIYGKCVFKLTDSYSLQTVKRGVYSTHMYWISNSCGPSGRRGAGREGRPWEPPPPAIAHPRSKHWQARQGPGAIAGCEVAVARRRCLSSLNLPSPPQFSTWPESSCPEDSSFLLHYSCPRAVGTARLSPPLNLNAFLALIWAAA